MEAASAAPTAAKGSIFDLAGGRPVSKESKASDAACPDRTSPTLVTLVLKSTSGKAFEAFDAAADEHELNRFHSGFERGMPSRDTGRLVATLHKIDGGLCDESLRVVEFWIDPAACELEMDAGSRLIYLLRRLAEDVGGTICDGTHAPMSDEALDALADHIDTVLKQRIDAAWNASAVTQPDGSLRIPGAVSFQNYTYPKKPGKRRSRKPVEDCFDVEALPYFAAHAKAFRMVAELQRTYREHKYERPAFSSILADALGVEIPALTHVQQGSRGNVVHCFMKIMDRVFANGLANTNPKWVVQQAEEWEAYAARSAAYREEDKAKFAERMRAGKAAKKAQRQGGAS